jgi:hypothetical protein
MAYYVKNVWTDNDNQSHTFKGVFSFEPNDEFLSTLATEHSEVLGIELNEDYGAVIIEISDSIFESPEIIASDGVVGE